MEFQSIANMAAMGAFAVIGWIGKTVYAAIKSLEGKHEQLALKVAEDYVSIERFDNAVNRLEVKVDRVLDRLDRKVDR